MAQQVRRAGVVVRQVQGDAGPAHLRSAILRNERLEAIVRLGRLAQQHGVSTVLVAGYVYDMAAPTDRTLRQLIERMRQFSSVSLRVPTIAAIDSNRNQPPVPIEASR